MTADEILYIFDQCHTDKGSGHCYHGIYAAIPSNINSIFEIGVDNGGSIDSWLNIFPQAHVYGIDIKLPKVKGHERVTLIHSDICDFDPASYPKFDVIVDDGSHIVSDVLLAWDKLKSHFTSTYIIEDVVQIDPLVSHISKSLKSMPGTWSLEVIQTGNRYPDDRVIRITNGI
jgi:hypothetical protein